MKMKKKKEVFVPHLIGIVDGDPRALTNDVPGCKEVRGGTFAVVFNCYDALGTEDPEMKAEGEREAEATAAEMVLRWNTYANMLEALTEMHRRATGKGSMFNHEPGSKQDICFCCAAIAKAKGQS